MSFIQLSTKVKETKRKVSTKGEYCPHIIKKVQPISKAAGIKLRTNSHTFRGCEALEGLRKKALPP
jgi:hypothetical protein